MTCRTSAIGLVGSNRSFRYHCCGIDGAAPDVGQDSVIGFGANHPGTILISNATISSATISNVMISNVMISNVTVVLDNFQECKHFRKTLPVRVFAALGDERQLGLSSVGRVY